MGCRATGFALSVSDTGPSIVNGTVTPLFALPVILIFLLLLVTLMSSRLWPFSLFVSILLSSSLLKNASPGQSCCLQSVRELIRSFKELIRREWKCAVRPPDACHITQDMTGSLNHRAPRGRVNRLQLFISSEIADQDHIALNFAAGDE